MTVTSVRPPISETDTTAAPDAMPEEAGQPEGKAPRGQSTIGFPYADLNDALVIAKTIRDRGGAPVAKDQLAAAMGQAATSGAFSAKLHAARMFGLVRFIAGKIKISDLAYEAIDTDEVRSKAAKVTAFLTVPLFARTYDEFRNRQLPPRLRVWNRHSSALECSKSVRPTRDGPSTDRPDRQVFSRMEMIGWSRRL